MITFLLDRPEWLETKRTELRREINTRLADLKDKRVREIKARLATLRTAEEKRKDLQAELERLQSKLERLQSK